MSTSLQNSGGAVPAAERAYVVTKDLILSGKLAAGSLVSEGDIAQSLDCSRTPVREAFLRLESEELLRLIPKRGAIVVPVPPTEAADILDIRIALETSAVQRLVTGDTNLSALTDELDTLIVRQSEVAKLVQASPGDPATSTDRAGHVADFAEVDELFHRSIVLAAGNAIATRFYSSLSDRQRRMTIGAIGPRPERLPTLLREHSGLRGTILTRDVAGFEAALRSHLTNTHSTFLRQ